MLSGFLVFIAIILFWVVSVKIAFTQGYIKGWNQGFEDTKKATFEVFEEKGL